MRFPALILAAGRSTRAAPENKLLRDVGGVPMVARVADAVLASRARPVLVVVGHQAALVRAALAGRGVGFVEAPLYAQGMAESLKAGIAALPIDARGVVVCLGDMPLVTPALIGRLVDAFDGRSVVPVCGGRRGNPVLISRHLFPALATLTGDEGARRLLGDALELAVDEDAIFADVDF